MFFSQANGFEQAQTTRGRGQTLENALADALKQSAVLPDPEATLHIDVVRQIWAVADGIPNVYLGGRWGIADDVALSRALPPMQVKLRRLTDSDGDFRPDRIARYPLNDDIDGTEAGWPVRFTVSGWSRVAGEWHALVGDNRPVPDMSRATLRAEIDAAADYLARAIDDQGRVTYDLRPWLQRSTNDYNILRHGGSVFSLMEAYRRYGDPHWLEAGERALGYLMAQAKPCPNAPELSCIVEEGEIKLGGNGLALVALSEYMMATGDRSPLPLAQRLAAWIVSIQQDNGAYRPHKQSWPEGEPDDFISAYYPGEAMLGLLRLHRLDGDPRWLESAARAAVYLRDGRDRGKADVELPHDHWLLYALTELWALQPRAGDRDHGMRIARTILAAQNLDPEANREPAEWRGSFYRPPRSTPTATRAEALMSAWNLANDSGQTELLPTLLAGLCEAVQFSLQTRYTPEKTMFTHDPARYRGGFHRSLTDLGVRIDYVQHNVSALMGLEDILERSGESCVPASAPVQ
ncbi:MAG: hypothetical protein AAGH19_08350 [Pseudomonadota bacterium]